MMMSPSSTSTAAAAATATVVGADTYSVVADNLGTFQVDAGPKVAAADLSWTCE